MTSRYIKAFISLQYMWILPLTGILCFVGGFVYIKTQNTIILYIVRVLGVVLLAVVLPYYLQKATLYQRLRKFKKYREYDDASIIGTSFVLENRTLIITFRYFLFLQMDEFEWSKIELITANQTKAGRVILTLVGVGKTRNLTCSTVGQAERYLAFVQKVNPDIKISGLQPNGDGLLQHIESGK